MDKKPVNAAGFSITQLTERTHEAENEMEKFDFYFDATNPNAVKT